MKAKTGRGVGGAYRIPLSALSGSGIVQRRAEASTRLGERANAVDDRCDGSSLFVFRALRQDVFCSDRCKSTASSGRCTCPYAGRRR